MEEKAIETWYSHRIVSGARIPKYEVRVSGFRFTNKLVAPSLPRTGERIVMGCEHWIVKTGRYVEKQGHLFYYAEFEETEPSKDFIDDAVNVEYKNGLMYVNGSEHIYRSEAPKVGDYVCDRMVEEVTKIYTNCVLFKGEHLLVNTETLLLTGEKKGVVYDKHLY
ncbi:MAG: hypothetical protein Ta2B_13220 [Termitinemataceae bacterium]|nr:MAG: hypothetical protein Ta2B_13220 [Termitinemataceae bacterium]